MHKLFHKFKKLRTNENILIAVDVLYNSKSSFMGIFLMSFMITVSLRNSPVSFLSYELSHYAFNGILCVLLADILRAHPLNSWRTSMFFNILQILAVIFINPNFPFFPLLIGFLVALEAQLYWRPKEFLEIKEVSNARRDRFYTTRQILVEITKIVMPVVLGIVISDAGYERAGIIILIISSVQLLLSILLRPTRPVKIQTRSLRESLHYAVAHKDLRRTLWLQTLRGFAMTGCAYDIVAQLNVYRSMGSNVELGGIQSAASIITIALLLIYRHFKKKSPVKSDFIVYGLLPATILLPLSAFLFPGNFVIAIALFIYTNSVIHSLYSSNIFAIYHQNELKKSIHDDAYRIEIQILGELWLTFGRVLSLIPLLAVICFGHEDWSTMLIAIQSIVIPIAIATIYKSATSQASSKR
ncbi:MAG: hypothetical protein MJ154_01815 [Candidatus Saccharibacteria bacterium]|nr:hypothetical protein [Candidatus Saccharibacteria bacterium]